MFLGKTQEKMMFRIESRETHNDQKLSRVYENFRTTKNRFITITEIQAKLVDLSFNQKMQNIAGMQVADLIAYPIGKWGLDEKADNKAYTGPSKIWFAYQDSLIEGCNRLAAIFSRLPASQQTASLIVETLLRLDRKLTNGGVDDSDGTVGSLIEEAVDLLLEFAKRNPECAKAFVKLENRETCFGEERLLKVYKTQVLRRSRKVKD